MPQKTVQEAAKELREKVVEIEKRIQEARKPTGPLYWLFGVHTSSGVG